MRSLLLTPPPLRKAAEPKTTEVPVQSGSGKLGRIYRQQGDVIVRRSPQAPTNDKPPRWFETHRYEAFRKNGAAPESIPLAAALPAFGIRNYLNVDEHWAGLQRTRYVEEFLRNDYVGELNLSETLGISYSTNALPCRVFGIEHDLQTIPLVIPDIVNYAPYWPDELSQALYHVPTALLRFGQAIIILPGKEPFFGPDDAAEYRAGGLITVGDDGDINAGLLMHELAHGILTDTPRPYQERLKAAIRFAAAVDGSCGPTPHAQVDEDEALCEGFQYFKDARPAMRQLVVNLMSEAHWWPQIRQPRLKRILKLRRD